MSNWKAGWCIGTDIDKVSDDQEENTCSSWRPDDLNETADHLENILRFLGKKDCDIVYLYFLSEKRQMDICDLMSRTQPAVSYDIRRAKEHINFAIYLLSVIDDFLQFIEGHGSEMEPEQVRVLVLMFFSTSFTKTAHVLGCHQITCRYLFDRAIKTLKANEHDNIVDIFDHIVNNLNMVKKTLHRNS